MTHFVIHARKAILKGLSPAQNRTVPPLRSGVDASLPSSHFLLQFLTTNNFAELVTGNVLISVEFNACFVSVCTLHQVRVCGGSGERFPSPQVHSQWRDSVLEASRHAMTSMPLLPYSLAEK